MTAASGMEFEVQQFTIGLGLREFLHQLLLRVQPMLQRRSGPVS